MPQQLEIPMPACQLSGRDRRQANVLYRTGSVGYALVLAMRWCGWSVYRNGGGTKIMRSGTRPKLLTPRGFVLFATEWLQKTADRRAALAAATGQRGKVDSEVEGFPLRRALKYMREVREDNA
jgi:hypothetical protein